MIYTLARFHLGYPSSGAHLGRGQIPLFGPQDMACTQILRVGTPRQVSFHASRISICLAGSFTLRIVAQHAFSYPGDQNLRMRGPWDFVVRTRRQRGKKGFAIHRLPPCLAEAPSLSEMPSSRVDPIHLACHSSFLPRRRVCGAGNLVSCGVTSSVALCLRSPDMPDIGVPSSAPHDLSFNLDAQKLVAGVQSRTSCRCRMFPHRRCSYCGRSLSMCRMTTQLVSLSWSFVREKVRRSKFSLCGGYPSSRPYYHSHGKRKTKRKK